MVSDITDALITFQDNKFILGITKTFITCKTLHKTTNIYTWVKSLTVFGTLSHVFFKRNTAAFVNAAHTCKTPLKLCRQRHMSATAVHFSIAATRDDMLLL